MAATSASEAQRLLEDGVSLTQGGPFYSLQQRLRLLPRPPQALGIRAPLAAIAFTWLPLVLLNLPERVQTGHWAPFLSRSEVHIRLLGALLLFLYGEAVLGDRARLAMRAMGEAKLLGADERELLFGRLQALIRLRHARLPEASMIAAVYAASVASALDAWPAWLPRWLLDVHRAGFEWPGASAASWWYLLVSQPVFLFVLLRWVFHWSLWGALLWKLAKLGPRTDPSHADRAGGLGFLAAPLFAMRFLVMGLSFTIVAVWLDEIALDKVESKVFASDVVVVVGITALMTVLPYVPFTRILIETKHEGEVAYSMLVRRFTQRFDARWLNTDAKQPEMLGHPDFSSLADLSAGFSIVKDMRWTIFGLDDVKAHLVATIVPFLLIPLMYGQSTQEAIQRLVMRLIGG